MAVGQRGLYNRIEEKRSSRCQSEPHKIDDQERVTQIPIPRAA